MRSWPVFIAAVIASTSTARANDRAHLQTRLIEAINKRDIHTVESLVVLPLRAEKVRFASEPCRKFWGVAVLVHTVELPAFVDCLASQKLTTTESATVYGPGFPLVVGFNAEAKVIALTSTSEPGSNPLRIEPSTFASHVSKFSREITPSAETKRTLDAHGITSVHAELSLCVDETGATVPIATVADAGLKSYEQDVTNAAHGWKIEPFQLDGKPQLACATYIVGYPAADLDKTTHVTIGPASIAPAALETLRIRGSKYIQPDDATKAKIQETDSRRVLGEFKLCIDEKGLPKDIKVLKPTGYDAYDQKIMREMATWAYRPYILVDSPVPVCTMIAFIYSMD